MIDPQDPFIKDRITGSPQMFECLLKIEKKAIKEAKNDTEIELKSFFRKVLVENSINAWSEVHEMVFLKNYYCQSIDKKSKASELLREYRISQQEYFENMLEHIWRAEPNQEYYRRLGLVEGNKHAYLLVKLNCNFHRLLRYQHILDYFRE